MNPHGLRAAAQLSPIRINAAGAQDARGAGFAPASLLIDARQGGSRLEVAGRPRLLAIGSPAEIDRDPRSRGAAVFEMPRTVVLPGFVNAHTHLDLTHIGPREHDPLAGFMPWVEMIRLGRAGSEEESRASVLRGIQLSRSAGVVAVGDIAGALRTTPPTARASLVPWRTMREAGMSGVSFLEFFAIGTGRERFRQWLPMVLEEALREQAADERSQHAWACARIGLQPHAPNTVCLDAYEWVFHQAAERGVPISTHLAESPEERRFVGEARGPMRELLERLGLWDETIETETGRGVSPVAHLSSRLGGVPGVLAHVNDASDADIELLAQSLASVAYCPRASEYFGAHEHFGPHRYRDMIAAGINVALGTDSLVNLPAAASRLPAEGGVGMSILEELRLLWKRDGTNARTLLAMGTVNGAAALGLPARAFTLEAGVTFAGLVGVQIESAVEHSGREPVELVLAATGPAQLLLN